MQRKTVNGASLPSWGRPIRRRLGLRTVVRLKPDRDQPLVNPSEWWEAKPSGRNGCPQLITGEILRAYPYKTAQNKKLPAIHFKKKPEGRGRRPAYIRKAASSIE